MEIAEGARQKIDVTRDLADLTERTPVRAIVEHRDLLFDWRDVLAVSLLITVHDLPDAGQMPHRDAPEAVRDLPVREFTCV